MRFIYSSAVRSVREHDQCCINYWQQNRSGVASRGIILSRQRTTKALIRLRRCIGWSASIENHKTAYSSGIYAVHVPLKICQGGWTSTLVALTTTAHSGLSYDFLVPKGSLIRSYFKPLVYLSLLKTEEAKWTYTKSNPTHACFCHLNLLFYPLFTVPPGNHFARNFVP